MAGTLKNARMAAMCYLFCIIWANHVPRCSSPLDLFDLQGFVDMSESLLYNQVPTKYNCYICKKE